jgi:Glycosyltransferase 61
MNSVARECSRWTPLPYISYAKGIRKCGVLGHVSENLENLAADSWEVAPGDTTITTRALSLPEQLSRVTGMAYTDDPARDMQGGLELQHAPTRALLLRDVHLIDGAIYKGRHRFDLYSRARLPRARRFFPTTSISLELERASIYSSFDGNEFFGLWLTDDCSIYPLAASAGVPVTTLQPASAHMAEYEDLLEMTPVRTNAAFLREAVFFVDEWGNNSSKHARFAALKAKLMARFAAPPHPGVFILRRNSGKPRIMENELQVAEHLRETRGFSVVDATGNSAAEILSACAGARVLAGIEGSHLMHGLMVLRRGASVLTIQPPDRFCSVIKRTTDMERQYYGYVVGRPTTKGFRVDLPELERTLDLMPIDSPLEEQRLAG